MARCLKAVLLFAAATVCSSNLTVSAQTKTISECSDVLSKRGFEVTQQDTIKDKLFEGVYEFTAMQKNEKWKFKTDESCNILYEHRVHWSAEDCLKRKPHSEEQGFVV